MGFIVSKNQGLFHANALIFVIFSLFFFWFVLAPQLSSHTILEPDQWSLTGHCPGREGQWLGRQEELPHSPGHLPLGRLWAQQIGF